MSSPAVLFARGDPLISHVFGCTGCKAALVNIERPLGSACGFVELHEMVSPKCRGVLVAMVPEGIIPIGRYLRAQLVELLRWKVAHGA